MMKDKDIPPEWATRRFKKMERALLDFMPSLARPEPTKDEIDLARSYADNPAQCQTHFNTVRHNEFERLSRLCNPSLWDLLKGKKLYFGNEVSEKIQQLVVHMWNSYAPLLNNKSAQYPFIVEGADFPKNIKYSAMVSGHIGSEFIFLSPDFVYHYKKSQREKNSKDDFFYKRVLAHEIAHILNDDVLESEVIKNLQKPFNEKHEILADRLGAIICGNPRTYWQDIDNRAFMAGRPKDRLDFHHTAKTIGYNNSLNERRYPSTSRQLRDLRTWARLLEREGAADPETGDIIDKEKALEIYQRSKDITTRFVDIESASHGFYR